MISSSFRVLVASNCVSSRRRSAGAAFPSNARSVPRTESRCQSRGTMSVYPTGRRRSLV